MRFRFTLKHRLSVLDLQFENNEFEVSISDWDQINSGSDTNFAWNNPSSARASGATANTSAIGQVRPDNPSIGWLPGIYTIRLTATNTSTGGSAPFISGLALFGSDTGSALDDSISYDGTASWEVGAGEIAREITFTISKYYQKLFFKFIKQGSGVGYNVVFTIDSIELIGLEEATEDQEISEPDGWKGAKIKLERDEQFFSLIERYEGAAGGAFIFYGENGEENGGIEFIRTVEENYGFNANIEFLAELSPDDVTYIEMFNGLMDLTGKNEMPDNKMQGPVIRDDFWTKFISRMDTPVNLSDTVDLDGNPVDAVDPVTINLKSQKIRYNGHYTWKETVQYPVPAGDGTIQLDWDTVILDDVRKFSLPRIDVTTTPLNLLAGIFEAPYDGTYTFDIRVETGSFFGGSWQNALGAPRLYIGNTGAGVAVADYLQFDRVSIDNGSGQFLFVHTLNRSFTLSKGHQLTIFGVTDSTAGETNVFGERMNNWLVDVDVASTIALVLSGTQTIDNYSAGIGDRVLAKNQGDSKENGVWVVAAGAWSRAADADTSAELQDATMEILNGDTNGGTYWIQSTEDVELGVTPITFVTTIYNDTKLVPYPGSGTPDNHLIITGDTTFRNTTAEGYLIRDLFSAVLSRIGLGNDPLYSEFLEDCGQHYVIIKGLQIRGYSIEEKPFYISFKQAWYGANPILNLGLGYEIIEDSPEHQVIIIEEKSHFVDDDISVYFSNVRDISSSYDENMIFKTIKTGFKKWQSEDISGIDDPQTKRTYSTIIKSGNEINLESDFIAAGLAIETTRRTTSEKSADYKYDNDNFIIALNQDDVSPDVYTPELDENFDSVSGLLNSDTRYNLILTPMRNLLRWANYLGGCLQSYTNSSYKFVSGEGNYDMVSDYSCSLGNQCQAILCDSLGESQDIRLGEPTHYNIPFGYFFLPMIYDITIPMEWEEYQEIRNNRKKSIGISQTDSGHVAFKIKLLEYDIVKGEALIKAWPKTFFRINVINSTPEMDCESPIPEPLQECYQEVLDYAETI